MFYIYILKSILVGKYYVGCTDNLERRLTEHNSGLSKYTKLSMPWKLVYTEQFENLSKARLREKQIKSWKKRSAIERLINGPIV
jgi:putative endonuclease